MLTAIIENLLSTFLIGKAPLIQHSVLLIVALVLDAEKPGVDGSAKKAEVLKQAEVVLTSTGVPAWLVGIVTPKLIDYVVSYLNKSGLFKKQ